jgi:serine/threonine protein kinase
LEEGTQEFRYDTYDPENEIKFQQRAAEIGVALPIHEIIRCTSEKKIGWVMERLDTTVSEELGLSDYQRRQLLEHISPLLLTYDTYYETIRLYVANHIENFEEVQETIDRITKYRKSLKTLINFQLLYNHIQTFFRNCFYNLPEFPIPKVTKCQKIILEDTPLQKKTKTRILAKVLLLLRKLHHIGIAHTDTHGGNLMSKDGRYYIIDFGHARKLLTEEEKEEQGIDDFCTEKDDIDCFIINIMANNKTNPFQVDWKYMRKRYETLQTMITYVTNEDEIDSMIEILDQKESSSDVASAAVYESDEDFGKKRKLVRKRSRKYRKKSKMFSKSFSRRRSKRL